MVLYQRKRRGKQWRCTPGIRSTHSDEARARLRRWKRHGIRQARVEGLLLWGWEVWLECDRLWYRSR